MPNGTLDDHLHKLRTPLSWDRRLKICIHAGCGLRFLHNETGIDSGIIHRDVKSSNILLHENWAAKISDFGLSKTCPTNQPSTYVKTRVKGSFGYFDPRYYHTGMLTRKSDVYAFGVVLLEVLCRKRAVDKTLDEDQWSLVGWVQDSIKEGKLKHITDSKIRGEISSKSLKEFVKLVDRCLQENPKQRPTMVEVVAGLENALNLQKRFIMQHAGSRTIFGKMVGMLPFVSNGEYYALGISKVSSNNSRIASNTVRADNSMFPKMKEVRAKFQSPSSSLKEYTFDDLENATKKFSPDLLLGEGDFGKVFLGWVEQNTLAPSKQGVEIAIAVKRFHLEDFQDHAKWLAEVNFLGHLAHPNIMTLGILRKR
ncbi:putative receptor-like protein kinase At5g39000 [Bidens hawaiensis]|uniref:putative receptor-like protein kinase At5g39000 n=1 Tax=Bidens hawaiensis TaxID=980011 RepID=UPI00404A3F1F